MIGWGFYYPDLQWHYFPGSGYSSCGRASVALREPQPDPLDRTCEACSTSATEDQREREEYQRHFDRQNRGGAALPKHSKPKGATVGFSN